LKPPSFFHIVFLAIIIILGINHPAYAEQSLQIEKVTYQYIFGDSLTITANLSKSLTLRNLTIIIQPENQQSRQVQSVINADMSTSAVYDLKSSGLIPFGRVYFWFEAELQDGSIATSPSYWFDYLDNRYEWKSNTSNLFNIFWVNGDTGYGYKLQQMSRSGLEKATQLIPVVPQIPITIYVYPDNSSLQSVLSPDSESWINGQAFLSSNRILVTDTPPLDDFTDLERTIPHEIMHLIQYQVMHDSYRNAPAWLVEGLSTQTELYTNPDLNRNLLNAIQNNTITPLSSLCSGFSKEPSEVIIDYAQSSSVVGYVQQKFGNQALLSMMKNSSTGQDCESIVNTSLGISISQLDSIWKSWISSGNSAGSQIPFSSILWIAIPSILLIVGVIILISRHMAAKKQEERE
jgi:hypothetical protein